jgi:hypothetical protein
MRWAWEMVPSFPLNDIVMNKMIMEKTRFEAVSPDTEVSMLTLQGKCSLSQAKAANSSGHLLPASRSEQRRAFLDRLAALKEGVQAIS